MFQTPQIAKCEEATIIANLVSRHFVYGTLRRGCSNAHAHELAAAARFIGHGRIRGRLFRVTHYSALAAPSAETDWVKGDLFENVGDEMLQSLDDYEGPEYIRVLAQVAMDNRQKLAVYLYSYVMPVERLELLPSGDWFQATAQSSQPE